MVDGVVLLDGVVLVVNDCVVDAVAAHDGTPGAASITPKYISSTAKSLPISEVSVFNKVMVAGSFETAT